MESMKTFKWTAKCAGRYYGVIDSETIEAARDVAWDTWHVWMMTVEPYRPGDETAVW